MPTDAELLSRFNQTQDERAFEELVHRHLGLVLGAARRRLPNRDSLTEDVAQRVFVTLVRKAGSLQTHPCLPAWLQKCAAHEALRASRKEQNYAKTMTKLRQERDADREASPPDPRFEAALPVLDEALAALGAGDRRAVMLRYYEGKSFKDIAFLSGKTEAASQKQTRRAIDKLAALLSRRGVAIPTTVLAAGLAPALCKAAPLAQATSIASSALNHLPTTGTSTLLTQLTLMKTKTALLIGSAVLIGCATTGYVTGRSAGTGPDTGSSHSATAPTSATQAASRSTNSFPGRSSSEKSETLLAILDRARLELQRGQHDVLAAARAKARLAAIPYDQIPAALELIAGMTGGLDGESTLTDALLTHWAAHDGEAACDFSLENRTPLAQGIAPIRFPLTAWAEVAPQAALKWYLARAAENHPALKEGNWGRYQSISNVRWVMTAWIHNDLEGAMEAYRSLENEKHREGARIAFSEYAGAVQDRTKLIALFLEDPKSDRDFDIRQAVGVWARERPEELARWVDNNQIGDIKPQTLAGAVLGSWVIEDSEAAVEWWMTRKNEEKQEARIGDLVRIWAESDVVGAGDWLAQQELDETFDRALKDYSFKAARKDPERGWDWALKVTGETMRRNALRGVVNNWKYNPPQNANERIESADLSDALKAELLELLKKKDNPNTLLQE